MAVRKILLVMMPHHRHAASRRRDDVFVAAEDLDKSLGQRRRVGGAAGVRHRLAAACLLSRKIDLDAQMREQLHGRHTHLRIKLVDIAGDEKTDEWHRLLRESCEKREYVQYSR